MWDRTKITDWEWSLFIWPRRWGSHFLSVRHQHAYTGGIATEMTGKETQNVKFGLGMGLKNAEHKRLSQQHWTFQWMWQHWVLLGQWINSCERHIGPHNRYKKRPAQIDEDTLGTLTWEMGSREREKRKRNQDSTRRMIFRSSDLDQARWGFLCWGVKNDTGW